MSLGLGEGDALDPLSQLTGHKVRKDYEDAAVERFVMGHVAKHAFFRRLALKNFDYRDEEYGWAAEFPESETYIAVDMTRCGLVDWFRDQGAPEIAPIACEGDFVVAEFMTWLELVRMQTLAAGDPVCDFRYVQ